MENQIDKTYFVGDIKITGLGSSEPEREEELNLLITQYQQEYLDRMFGIGTIADENSPLIPYIKDETTKKSPLANYIYCIYKQNEAANSTNTGDKKLNIQNTTEADYRLKIVNAWNKMVAENQRIHNKLYTLENIDGVNYLNDIMGKMGNCFKSIIRGDGKSGIIVSGGIFNVKTIYDYNK